MSEETTILKRNITWLCQCSKDGIHRPSSFQHPHPITNPFLSSSSHPAGLSPPSHLENHVSNTSLSCCRTAAAATSSPYLSLTLSRASSSVAATTYSSPSPSPPALPQKHRGHTPRHASQDGEAIGNRHGHRSTLRELRFCERIGVTHYGPDQPTPTTAHRCDYPCGLRRNTDGDGGGDTRPHGRPARR